MKFMFIAPSEADFLALSQMTKHANARWRKSLEAGTLRNPDEITQYGVVRGLFSHLHLSGTDAFVAPGNSFGHMTGGFDKALVDVLGVDLDTKVRNLINEEYLGEMPVGTADFIEIAERFVIYAPTMRVPKELPHGTDVPFLATSAALNVIHQLNKDLPLDEQPIKSVLIPLMGVGTGKVPRHVAAMQIYAATVRYTEKVQIGDLWGDGGDWDRYIADSWKLKDHESMN